MSFPIPDLPVLPADNSILSQKFGRECVNYFAGNPLNRLGFLRGDHVFLSAAWSHPTTSFILLNNLAPLASEPTTLARLSRADVEPVTGPEPYKKTEKEWIAEFNSEVTQPLILFLGIDERKKTGFEYRNYAGAPYFAIDITPRGTYEEAAKHVIESLQSKGMTFLSGRAQSLSAIEAAIFGTARHLLDWNARIPFCAGCGRKTLSINAGTKRVCPPTDLAGVPEGGAPKERPDCPTRHGVSNVCFPRTDPTMIVAVVNADGTKMLLGRQKRWPPYWFSCLAGFLEPGESIEEAVRREVWEESGVLIGRVVIYSSQPWPYPANLMIGCIAQATPEGEKIHLGNDAELDAAKWFDINEVREVLPTNVSGLTDPPPEGYKEGSLRMPAHTAIANRLITAVAEGFVGPTACINELHL